MSYKDTDESGKLKLRQWSEFIISALRETQNHFKFYTALNFFTKQHLAINFLCFRNQAKLVNLDFTYNFEFAKLFF